MSDGERRAVLLDRDGTLIDVVRDEETGVVSVAFHPRHVRLLPGVLEGLRALADAGYALGLVTNQPGAAKGQVSAVAIDATNRALVELLAGHGISLGAVAVCLHHPEGGTGGDPALIRACTCRKPAPGLLVRAMNELGVPPARTWMIGDQASDLDAARAADVRSAWLSPGGRCELCPLRDAPEVRADLVAGRFDQLVARILEADASVIRSP